jgi:hypothetical protein
MKRIGKVSKQFEFTNVEVWEAKAQEKKKDLYNPPPPNKTILFKELLEKPERFPEEYHYYLTWDSWYHVVPSFTEIFEKIVKKMNFDIRKMDKELGNLLFPKDNELSAKRKSSILQKWTKNTELLKISWKDEELKFSILQPWIARIMDFPEVYIFKNKYPLDAHCEIMNRIKCI